MIVVASRQRTQPPPPHIVWRSLVEPHAPDVRPWLVLRDGEIEPTVIEAIEPDLVVWSSIWPDRPNDRIHFDLSVGGGGTMLRWTLQSPLEQPDAAGTRELRQRINVLINQDLRMSYDL